MECSVFSRGFFALVIAVAASAIGAGPSTVAVYADTALAPASWATHTWHYPVIKRPLSAEEIRIAGEMHASPVVRLAGGEYEMAVMGVHSSDSGVGDADELVVDVRELPRGYHVAVYYLPPFTVERKTRWFDPASVRGEWFDPVVPLLAAPPPAGPTPIDGILRYDISFVPAVTAGKSVYFLFEIRAPRGGSRRAGLVRVHVTSRSNGGESTGAFPSLRVEPFGFDLPEEHTLPLLAGIVPEDVFDLHRTYGLLPEEEGELWLRYLTLLRTHRIVPYDPSPEKEFTWESFESVSLPLYRGELTPDGVPAPAIRFPRNRQPDGSSERRDLYRDVAGRLRSEGLMERAFYYVDDEPLMGDYTRLIADAREIAETVPELRRLVTESYNPQLAGLIDIWCPDIAMLNQPVPFFPVFGKGSGLQPDFQMNPDAGVYRAEMDAGKELWLYTCTSAQYADLPNLFIDAPAAASRIIPWVVHRFDATGMVYFRVTQAYKDGNDPWKNQYYFNANGDGTLVYPAVPDFPWSPGHGAVASLRMKLLRDGLEDYEYMSRTGARASGYSSGPVRSTTAWEHDLTNLAAARDALGEEVATAAQGTPHREVESFNQVSQPSLAVDYWYVPAFAAPGKESGSFGVPSYRHLLASTLDAGRRQATVATRGRWQAYLQVGPVLGLSGDSYSYGGYSAVGWTVSPETSRRLNRTWLIPYVGIEGGVITGNDGSRTSTGFAGSVLVGVHIWSSPRTSLTLGGAWTHTTTDAVPVALRGTLSFDFVFDGR